MDFTGERLVPDEQRDDDLYHEHILRYMFACHFAGGRSVLDAGCGAGYGAALLAKAGATSVIGLDVSAEAIAYARAHYQHPRLSFEVADIAAAPLPDASIGLLVSFEVIEHLDDPAALVATAARLLAPDGLLLVSTPNPATYPAGNPFHTHEMARDDFLALLRRYFAAVGLYEQDFATSLTVRPSADDEGLDPGWRLMPAAGRPAREPDYYIAVCARGQDVLHAALRQAPSIMYELPADRLGERIGDALTLQRLLDQKTEHIAQKDAHIAQIEEAMRRQSAWAGELQRRLLALQETWYARLFGRRLR